MKKILINTILIFITNTTFSQINTLKIEGLTRGFSKEINLTTEGLHYRYWKGFGKEKKLSFDTLIVLRQAQKDSIQLLARSIDFSTLSTWKSPSDRRAACNDYYTNLTVNGIKSSYYDFDTPFIECKAVINYILTILNEAEIWKRKKYKTQRIENQ